jgi:hypothetical protein
VRRFFKVMSKAVLNFSSDLRKSLVSNCEYWVFIYEFQAATSNLNMESGPEQPVHQSRGVVTTQYNAVIIKKPTIGSYNIKC